MKRFRSILFVSILFVCLPLWADTWSNPTWHEMLSKSDIIGLFKVKEGNAYKARLEPIEIYKGQLKDDHIWYTGYSNKFGPLDKLKPGERYILFLQSPKKYTSRFNSSSGSGSTVANNLYRAYDFVRSQPNGYTAWTPTAGEVRIKNKRAYYDLVHTGFSYSNFHRKKENSLSSAMFIDFIKAYVQKSRRPQFKENLVRGLKMKLLIATEKDRLGEKIMMLYHLDNQEIYDVFMEIPHINNAEVQFALAKQLKKLKGGRKEELKLALLASPFTEVRSEVVEQISINNADVNGALLLKQLEEASDSALYANVMSPDQQDIASELVKIIDKLKEMNYKEASPKLLEMMAGTSDYYVFQKAASALDHFGTTGYEDLLVERIREPNGLSIDDLRNLIYKNRSQAVKVPLMDLIASEITGGNDFEKKQDKLSAIECLSFFKGDIEIERFMIDQLKQLTKDASKRARRSTHDFIEKYVEGLTKLESQQAQGAIHQSLFYWFGLTPDYHEDRLMSLKTESEKREASKLDEFINDPDRKAYARAFITNSTELQKERGTSPNLIFIYKIQVLNNKRSFNALGDIIEGEKERLMNQFDIDPDNLGFTTGRNLYNMDARLSMTIAFTFLDEYFAYVRSFGTKADINMLNIIEKHILGPRDKSDLRKLNETRTKLKKLIGDY
ncbi:MAG: hypothetical protein HEP71_01645 [Roseivirga sp.]|nr:hypothetical protein [Roseivirga sp.]